MNDKTFLTVTFDLPQPGTVYRHYKGGLYTAICMSYDESTHEPLVTYCCAATGKHWTRPLKEFQETVDWPDGTRHHRYRRIDR